MDQLITALASSSNVAIVALAVMVMILFTLLREREKVLQDDRREMIATLTALTEVITQLRVQLAQDKK